MKIQKKVKNKFKLFKKKLPGTGTGTKNLNINSSGTGSFFSCKKKAKIYQLLLRDASADAGVLAVDQGQQALQLLVLNTDSYYHKRPTNLSNNRVLLD